MPGVSPAATGPTTISENWSGYAATAVNKFTYVHAEFVEPHVTCNGDPNEWASDWVGFDAATYAFTVTWNRSGTPAPVGVSGRPVARSPNPFN